MSNYDFTTSLSPIDFELLSKDLLEAELGIILENFSEGRDKGIDLRYAAIRSTGNHVFRLPLLGIPKKPSQLIVQCKRYSTFADLKSKLKNEELAKIIKLNPERYILTTSVSLSPQQADELKSILSPFVQSTGDIFGKDRLNSILTKHEEIERRNIKLWIGSAGVLDSIINAGKGMLKTAQMASLILTIQKRFGQKPRDLNMPVTCSVLIQKRNRTPFGTTPKRRSRNRKMTEIGIQTTSDVVETNRKIVRIEISIQCLAL
jgi:hypothetical protein